MVRTKGLEPSRLAAPDPKSGVSANSTTRASADKLRRAPPNLKPAFARRNCTMAKIRLISSHGFLENIFARRFCLVPRRGPVRLRTGGAKFAGRQKGAALHTRREPRERHGLPGRGRGVRAVAGGQPALGGGAF